MRTERPVDRLGTEVGISGFIRKSQDILRAYLGFLKKIQLATLRLDTRGHWGHVVVYVDMHAHKLCFIVMR